MMRYLVLLTILFSGHARASVADANALFFSGNYEAALSSFEDLATRKPEDAQVQYLFARSLYRMQRMEQAEAVLSSNVARSPEHVESHLLLGSVRLNRVADVGFFSKVGMAKSALAAWQRTIELDTQHIEGLYAVASYLLSAPRMAGGDKEAGAEALTRLDQVAPAYALLVKASLNRRDENFREAESKLTSAIAQIPDRAFPLLILADLYIKQARYDEALAVIEDYRARDRTWNDPGEAQVSLMTGRALAGMQDNSKARKAFEMVLASNPPPGVEDQARKALKAL